MTLDEKTLELVAIGASVALASKPALERHVNAAIKAGATLAEIQGSVRGAEKVRQELKDLIKRIREELNNE